VINSSVVRTRSGYSGRSGRPVETVETCRANRHTAKVPCCWIERWRAKQEAWDGVGMQLLTEGGMPRAPSIRQVGSGRFPIQLYGIPSIYLPSERAARARN